MSDFINIKDLLNKTDNLAAREEIEASGVPAEEYLTAKDFRDKIVKPIIQLQDAVKNIRTDSKAKSHGDKIIVGRLPKLSPYTVGNKYLITSLPRIMDFRDGQYHYVLRYSVEAPPNCTRVYVQVGNKLHENYWHKTPSHSKFDIENGYRFGDYIPGPEKRIAESYGDFRQNMSYLLTVVGYEERIDGTFIIKVKLSFAEKLQMRETASPYLMIQYGRIVSVQVPTRACCSYHKYKTYKVRPHKTRQVVGIVRKYSRRELSLVSNLHKCRLEVRTRRRWKSKITIEKFISRRNINSDFPYYEW